MKRALVLLAAGCGRLRFDPLGDAGASGDSRAIDAASDSLGGPADACVWSAWSTPAPLPAIFQSSDDDWEAQAAGPALYFYSFRNRATSDADLFVAPVSGASGPVAINELNSSVRDAAPSATADGLLIVFQTNRLGGAEVLFGATRTATVMPFNAPQPFSIDCAYAELSADGLRLSCTDWTTGFFLESRRASRANNFVGTTTHSELGLMFDATLSADGLDIYFASNAGGSYDIYTAHRAVADGTFATASIVPELSSARDDLGVHLTPDGATMYINYNVVEAGGNNADLSVAQRSCL